MLSGRFTGTMALTEPQAGSSLADLRTTAAPTDEGHYLIKGAKIYISGGEHELSDNIVNLVLARIRGAPAGVKGISMFIVPKYRLDAEGNPAERNGVELAGLIHKLGYRGTTSTALSFGSDNECHGYLVGEPHQGLKYMFQMMNEARAWALALVPPLSATEATCTASNTPGTAARGATPQQGPVQRTHSHHRARGRAAHAAGPEVLDGGRFCPLHVRGTPDGRQPYGAG